MAIYGWETSKEALRYTREANRARLARGAMHLIEPGQHVNESAPLQETEAG